ncbi:MAG: hypothetical protein EKK35_06645 [Bradyrhizobiaceae bacterium]|nr:MAG: hypothetical protein EKK35_06645 [Bradyrhizobiaceae bacterium]
MCRHCEERRDEAIQSFAATSEDGLLRCARNDERERLGLPRNFSASSPRRRGPMLPELCEGDAGATFSPSPRRAVVMGPRFRGDDIGCVIASNRTWSQTKKAPR